MGGIAVTSKFSIVLADPAWPYNRRNNPNTRFGRGVHGHYPTMTVEEICQLDVPSITNANCALFLWATWPKLPLALQVMESWRFEYKTCAFLYVKLNPARAQAEAHRLGLILVGDGLMPFLDWMTFFGIGYFTKSNSEVCLLGIKGKMKPVSNYVSQIVYAPRGQHSAKPPIVRDKIVELFGNLPRIELFGREKVSGWSSWGLEVENDIEL